MHCKAMERTMKQFDWKTLLICVLTTACLTLWWGERTPTRASGTVNSNDDMIAVTGSYGSGASVLYLIDTKARQMAVYTSRNGKGVELVAARRIATDLELMSYRDDSPPSMRPMALQKNYKRYLSGQTEESIIENEDFGPATPIRPTEGGSAASESIGGAGSGEPEKK